MSEVYDLKNTKCLHCGVDMPKRMSMANSHQGKLTKGMIMICSNCGGAMILGDSSWRPMVKEDFQRLPPESKQQLMVVVQQLRERFKTGEEWSPYDRPGQPGASA